jgi:hypothetical protein
MLRTDQESCLPDRPRATSFTARYVGHADRRAAQRGNDLAYAPASPALAGRVATALRDSPGGPAQLRALDSLGTERLENSIILIGNID